MLDRVLNAGITELCGVAKEMDERIDESVLRWLTHTQRMGNDRTVKRGYVGECEGSLSVERPQERRIDSMNDCLK